MSPFIRPSSPRWGSPPAPAVGYSRRRQLPDLWVEGDHIKVPLKWLPDVIRLLQGNVKPTGTIFGNPVNDGCDPERGHARVAIGIVRDLLHIGMLDGMHFNEEERTLLRNLKGDQR